MVLLCSGRQHRRVECWRRKCAGSSAKAHFAVAYASVKGTRLGCSPARPSSCRRVFLPSLHSDSRISAFMEAMILESFPLRASSSFALTAPSNAVSSRATSMLCSLSPGVVMAEALMITYTLTRSSTLAINHVGVTKCCCTKPYFFP